jgi:hypothetical protein
VKRPTESLAAAQSRTILRQTLIGTGFMSRCRLLPLCMLLAVTFNHFHCLGTTAQAAGVTARLIERVIREGAPRDFGSIPRCENETGCICRGAIFIAPPSIDSVHTTACQWPAESHAELFATADFAMRGANFASLDREHFAQPISGRALRAWLAVYLI